MAIDPFTSVIDLVKTGVDKIFPDAGEQERNAVNALVSQLNSQIKLISTEMSGNWLQRSWRPILMLSITAILINNYILFPYLSLFGFKTVLLDFPDRLWTLLSLGVSGYVVGRSVEKSVGVWRKG